ncbi:hypothetical protein [Methylobacterium flocculans]|uniref:hypothetical protein n=1 Tax=Methylobacterium flocculans TaxID=2984843 RepID=UPI0021F2681F|nr:hypothetical protein [Methylobacterium sp. FF17]
MFGQQASHRAISIRAVSWLIAIRAAAFDRFRGLLFDYRAIGITQAGKLSKTQFERDVSGYLLPLSGESEHLTLHRIIVASPDLLSECPAPSNGKRSAAKAHAIRDAGQHHLPVLRAQGRQILREAEVVSGLFSCLSPLEA